MLPYELPKKYFSIGVEMIPIIALMKIKYTIKHICDELKFIKEFQSEDLKTVVELHVRVKT